jgi:histidine triad (HIT) family protein
MSKGHVLVVPKKEIDYIFDMSDTEYNQLLIFAKKISLAIKKVINCKRVSLNIVGLDVPHVHIHLIPINSISDLNFEKKKLIFSEDEFKDIAILIRDAI